GVPTPTAAPKAPPAPSRPTPPPPATAEAPATNGAIASPQAIDPRLKPVASATGFFVDQAGHVLTNFHVVRGCTQVAMIFGDDVVVTRPLVTSAEADLALLDTRVHPPAFATFRTSAPEIGEATY